MRTTELPRHTLYASFLRRFQAVQVDGIILALLLAAILTLVMLSGSDILSRLLGFGFMLLLVLYEPVLVSTLGGTLGHLQRNLHVVDDRTGGHLGFGKALARTIIKVALGWLSLITMATSRRHQAVHDLATRSTVRIRNASLARPSHFALEREARSAFAKRSPIRVGLVIVAYEVAMAAVALCAVVVLVTTGAVSMRCLEEGLCRGGEKLAMDIVSKGVLVLFFVIIVMGLAGNLYGCRRKRLAA